MEQEAAKGAALALLQRKTVGVLATASRDTQPHASPIYYVCDERFNLYFFTALRSRKRIAVGENYRAAFTVFDEAELKTVQLEGVVSEIANMDEATPQVLELVKILTAHNTQYAPITRMDPEKEVLMWFEPKWVRLSVFSAENREDLVTEIALA